MIQLLKKNIFSILISINLIIQLPLYGGLPGMPGGFQLSQQQIEQMNKELENIDKFFNSLSPEEQTEFLKQVEEAQKMLNNMSPEELNQLAKEMEQYMPEVFGGIPGEVFQKPVTQPETIKPTEVPTVKKAQTENLSEDELEALNLIESLIKHVNEFIVKINSAPEVSIMIERWGARRKITGWSHDKKWSLIYNNFDIFVKKLSELKDKDPVTMSYRYLKNVSSDKSLVTMLKNINSTLVSTVPETIIPTFGITDMSKNAKAALKKSINSLVDVIENKNIFKSIDTIIEKFLPEAQKIKMAEAQSKSLADQKAQIKPQQGKTVVAGKADQEKDFFNNNFYDNNNYYPGSSSYYGSSDSFGGYNSYNSSDKSQNLSKNSSTPTSTSSSSSGTTSSSNQPKSTKKEKNPYEKTITEIVDLIADSADLIEDDPILSKIDEHLKNKIEPVNETSISIIKDIERKITKATSTAQSLNRKLSEAGEVGKKYKAELKKQIEKHSGPVNKLKNKIKSSNNMIGQISPEKRYAYFKESVTLPKDKTVPQSSISLNELVQLVDKFYKTINK